MTTEKLVGWYCYEIIGIPTMHLDIYGTPGEDMTKHPLAAAHHCEPSTKIDVTACNDTITMEACRLYNVYVNNADGLNYQGLPCPAWVDLPQSVQSHWCAVAIASCRQLLDPTDDEHG